MTSQELYYEFHLVFNKNASYQNVHVSKGNFVILFNRELLNWLNDYIDKNGSIRRIHGIQGLITVDEKLVYVGQSEKSVAYKLPNTFFDFIDCSADVRSGSCTAHINNFLDNPKEAAHFIANYKPSFKFEEGLCNIANEKVFVYKGDFEINQAYLSYYQKPKKIDIEGYERIDGTQSTNINSDLDEMYQSEVINRVVLEVMRQFENGNGFKLSQDRPLV